MKKLLIVPALIASFTCSLVASDLPSHLPKRGEPTAVQLAHGGSIQVTADNFIEAESDKYFFEEQEKNGMNAWNHNRDLVTKETQTVVRQNRDVLYSKGIFDTKGGATFELPIHKEFQTLQIIDILHRTVAVLEAEEGKNKVTVTPKMLSSGQHVWVVGRTQVSSQSKEDLAKGAAKQDAIKVTTKSKEPYVAKGFDQHSREVARLKFEPTVMKIDFRKGMGAPEVKAKYIHKSVASGREVVPFDARGMTAIGFGGLPSENAWYKILVSEDRSGACQVMEFDTPPLQEKGFFSITTYGSDAYIHEENYALSSRKGELQPNEDGSYTVHFNCDDAINNIDVQENWTGALRMYMPKNLDEIVSYSEGVALPHTPKK